MTGELISGAILKYFGICPWDYSQSPYHVFGLIRLDYFPAWFCAGLLYEKLLNRSFLHHTSTWIEK